MRESEWRRPVKDRLEIRAHTTRSASNPGEEKETRGRSNSVHHVTGSCQAGSNKTDKFGHVDEEGV